MLVSSARSAAARLLGLRVRIPPRARMSVSYDCCLLSGVLSLRRADPSSRGVLPSSWVRVRVVECDQVQK
jgi:hypothetical protein